MSQYIRSSFLLKKRPEIDVFYTKTSQFVTKNALNRQGIKTDLHMDMIGIKQQNILHSIFSAYSYWLSDSSGIRYLLASFDRSEKSGSSVFLCQCFEVVGRALVGVAISSGFHGFELVNQFSKVSH